MTLGCIKKFPKLGSETYSQGSFLFYFRPPEADASRDFFMGRFRIAPPVRSFRYGFRHAHRSNDSARDFQYTYPKLVIAVCLVIQVTGVNKILHNTLNQLILHVSKTPFFSIEAQTRLRGIFGRFGKSEIADGLVVALAGLCNVLHNSLDELVLHIDSFSFHHN